VAKELHDPAIRERPFDHELPLSASGAARLGVLKDGPTARFQDKQALRSNVPRLAYVDVPSSLEGFLERYADGRPMQLPLPLKGAA
jgi:hypothetical protein